MRARRSDWHQRWDIGNRPHASNRSLCARDRDATFQQCRSHSCKWSSRRRTMQCYVLETTTLAAAPRMAGWQ